MANRNVGPFAQAPVWHGTILPDPNDATADEWETLAMGADPDEDAQWEDIHHLETSSGDTNWYDPPIRSNRPEKLGDPGRTIKLGPPWAKFKPLYIEQGLPPLPRDPPLRPKRPVRESVLSMIRCGIIDDTANHTSSQALGWWIRSGTPAYCRISRRRHRGRYSTYYYHHYVAADGTQAAAGSIWFNQQFLDTGLARYLKEAEDRHKRWYNRSRRAYFRFLRVWQKNQLAWEEEIFNLVVDRAKFPLTWSPLPYIYPGDLPQEPSISTLSSNDSDSSDDAIPVSTSANESSCQKTPPGADGERQDPIELEEDQQPRDHRLERDGRIGPLAEPGEELDDDQEREGLQASEEPTTPRETVINISRIERWLQEVNPRDPDRTDAYLDPDNTSDELSSVSANYGSRSGAGSTGQGNVSNASESLHNPPNTPEGDNNGWADITAETLEGELSNMMHPLQRFFYEQQQQRLALRRNEARSMMPEADRTMMNRMAIALARSQGATINPRTGRPSKHARKKGKWQLPPRRFLRSTEQQQPGPSTPRPTTDQPSHRRGQSAPIARTRLENDRDIQQRQSAPAIRVEPRPVESSSQQPPSRPRLRLIRVRDEIVRQLNFTEFQAERYREAERDAARARAEGLPWTSRRRSSHTTIEPPQQPGRAGSAEENHVAHERNPDDDHPMPDADSD
ncbi:MAG: hypothetical protein M1823_002551 [Watsoniomyces obsoletus]|nr:MAG: hypothetical protein M1823_002551 [Watsoniomyces obsoletus]